ncbi:hypothetical protein BKE38_05065 [Pseudoroseomonas deserti]|uniref:Bacteriophage tail tape measure N-terminal domain-containing protein n=1 Tax=Teichococcus deserti TaxID=1817963 RepID=A0A1V2H762_9PROT|nr:hypothetical protein [Pseudoroseomonas deserti]ONG56966.1 hypothetical protein BKE38_05065 [Pseudoroseomonas deserti]
MSGSAGDLPIKIGVEGLPQVDAAFSQLEARLNTTAGKQRQYEQATLLVQRAQEAGVVSTERASQVLQALQTRYESNGRAAAQLATANDNLARSSNQVAHQVQNASYQVGDFFVQVASGQSAITALAQQLPQLLGGFGMIGALAGAGVAIGAVVYRLLEGKTVLEQHDEVMKRVNAQYEATTKAAEEWVSGLDKQAERLNVLRSRYQGLTADVKQYEERQLAARRAELTADTDRLMDQGVDLSPIVSRLRTARSVATGSIADVSFGDLPAQVQAVTRVLDQYSLSTANAAERSLELSNGLSAAQRMGGPLTSTLEPLVKGLDGLRPKLLDNSDALKLVDQMLNALRGESIPGAVGALADLMRQADAAKTPFATLQQSISDTNARLQALRTGGLDALKAATEAQSDAAKIRKTENELAAAEAQRLQQTVQDEAERNRLFIQGAAERTRAATEAVQAERTLANETAKAEEAKREAERRARESAAASRRASAEALAQERAEATALARVWDTLRRDGQSGLLVGSENDVTALRAIRDSMRGTALDPKGVEKRAKETERLLEKQQQQAERTTDDVVRYGSDLFADMFATTEGGWDRMWSNMRRTATGILARIAAEAIIRPIVAPIVSGGMAFGSAGSAAAAAGGLGAGGSSGGGLGNLLQLHGMGSSFSEALGLGGVSSWLGLSGGTAAASSLTSFGSLAGLMSMPILTTGNLGAATTAALAGMGGVAGPATPAAVAAAGASSLSLGSLLGGAGLGFGAGTLLNTLVGGKSTGGMIGAGAGGLAGAGLGFLLGGPAGVLLGGLLGGSGGGLLGGLFGANAPRPAASVQFGVNADGQLDVTGSKSKWMDDAEAIGAVQEALVKLNTTINGLGLSLDSGVVGQQHFGKDSRPEEDQRNMTLALLGGLRGGSAAMQQVIQSELGKAYAGDDNLDRALANVAWVKEVFDPLINPPEAVSAFQQSIDAVMASFDSAKVRAGELGLATDQLVQKQLEQVFSLQQQRDATVWGIDRGLDIRRMRATGNDRDADLLSFDIAAIAERASFRSSLEALGLTADAIAQRMVTLEETLGAERLAVQQRYAEQIKQAEQQAASNAAGVIGSLADYARSLNYSDASPLGASEQFMTARSLYLSNQEAALRGDAGALGQFQGLSQDYLTAARNLYGSGSGYASAFEQVKSALDQIGTLTPDTLTASFQQQITQTQTETLVAALGRMQEENAAMRRELQQFTALMARRAA